MLWILIQIPAVQNRLAQYAAQRLSKELQTTVQVRNVHFTLFNQVHLEGVYMADQQQDTLLYAGELQMNITDWFFLKDSADIKYIGLKDGNIYVQRSKDSVWNYQFIADYFSGKNSKKDQKQNKDTSTKGIALHLKTIQLENVHVENRDKFRGKTSVISFGTLACKVNNIDFQHHIFDIAELRLQKPVYTEYTYKGTWSYEDSLHWRKKIMAMGSQNSFPANPGGIQLHIQQVDISDGSVALKKRGALPSLYGQFNAKDIVIQNLTGNFTNLRWNKDSFTTKINCSAIERSGLAIHQLQTDFTLLPTKMELDNLDLRLNKSRLKRYYSMQFNSMNDFDDFERKIHLAGNFNNALISTDDLSFFAPGLRDKHQDIIVNGQVTGTLDQLFASNFNLQVNKTNIKGSLHIYGLPKTESIKLDFTTPGSTMQLGDIAAWAPGLHNLNRQMQQGLQTVSFKGSFYGPLKDFTLRGDIETQSGSLHTDLQMNLQTGNGSYSAKVNASRFDIGQLLQIPEAGKIDFEGTIDGKGFNAQSGSVLFNGKIKNADYRNYTYTDMDARLTLHNGILQAAIQVNDPNLEGSIEANVDLQARQQSYVGKGYLSKANLRALHFSNHDLKFTGTFDVNFSGSNIDDFLGYAKFQNVHLSNNDIPFKLDSFYIYSHINPEGKKELEIQTNEMDASVVGKFNIAELPASFQYFLGSYYPAIIDKPQRTIKNQDFIVAFNTKEIEDFLVLFDSKIKGFNHSNIIGTINTNDDQLLLNISVPHFQYNNITLDSTAIIGNGSLHRLDLSGTVGSLRLSDSLSFYNTTLNITTENEVSHFRLSTDSEGQISGAEIDALVTIQEGDLKWHFNPSSFLLHDKKWQINQNGEILFKKNKQLVVNNISLKQQEQQIDIFTMPSDESGSNDVHISTQKINMGDLLPYVLKAPRIEGMASGKFVISNITDHPNIYIDSLQMNEFRFNGDSIGVLSLRGSYAVASGRGQLHILSPNEQYNFEGEIALDIKDSTGNQINAPIQFNHTRLTILDNYLETLFDRIDGYATGMLTINGKLDKPELIGNIRIDSAVVKVDFTKVTYFIDSAIVNMRQGYMNFGTTSLRDRYGNRGVLKGGFAHHFFKEMAFDIDVSTPRMELLNTTFKDNQTFYGNAVGSGSFRLKGPASNSIMQISAEPTDSSHISITNLTSRESGEADYIVFKQYGRQQETSKITENNLTVEVDLKAGNKTQIDVVLDPNNGDIMKAWGNGRLKITNDKDGMRMKGRYDIEKGNYNYSFQSFIRKGFDLRGEGNNYIEWITGDPMDAIINIDAIYQAKNVRFSDLNGTNNRLNLTKSTAGYKGDINVIASLRGKLAKPTIDFKLDFPAGSTIKNDPSATIIIDGINNNQDKSELLKQVTYLIVFNQFAPYGEGKGNRNPTADLAVNTISEFLSREMGKILSNVLYQITGDRSLQVDFSTSVYNSTDLNSGNVSATSGYDRTRLNFKIGKSLANNRIIINIGSDFDFSVRNSAVNTFQFLPDISVEFILSANRKLRAILFKKDNLELGARQNRAGASIGFRQDFNSFLGKSGNTAIIKRK